VLVEGLPDHARAEVGNIEFPDEIAVRSVGFPV